MATSNVVVNVVDVGQGQCTFVEVYDNASTPKLTNALLFDCGSDKTSDETQTNLDYIVTKVQELDDPGFDCIFFSHSDKDHISLTRYVVDELAKAIAPKLPKVKEVWYGGAHVKYTKYGFNILDELVSKKYCASANMKSTPSNYTGYDPTSKAYTNHLWTSADNTVKVYPIASNVVSDDPDWDDNDAVYGTSTAEQKNQVSMVCGLYFGGASYVICGDATNKTMAAINTLFTAGTTVFDKNNMLTLPHHGSRATGLAVKSSATASFGAIMVVNTFSSTLKSKTITVSAFQKHRHPSLELMNQFIPTITTPILRDPRLVQKNAHRATAYADIDLGTNSGITIFKNVVYSFETNTNVFTTRYYDGATTFSYNLGFLQKAKKSDGVVLGQTINGFASWKFQTDTSGNFTIGGYSNMSSALFTGPAVTTSSVRNDVEAKNMEQSIAKLGRQIRINRVRKPASSSGQFRSKLKHFT